MASFSPLTARRMSPFWKPTLWRRRAVRHVEDDDAGGGAFEPQFIGQRRRQVRDLEALERRTAGDGDLVARQIRRGFERDRDLRLLAAAHDARPAPGRRADAWRSGSRRRSDRRLPCPSTATMTSPVLRPGARRGALRRDGGHDRAGRALEIELLRDVGRHGLELGAEPRPLHRGAAALRRGDHHAHHVGRDGEADALRAARAREDRGVDADDLAGHVDQRAARVAGIDRGVGLDEELIVADADLGAGHRRDDAVGHGLADAERIADREHQVADLQLVGVGEIERTGNAPCHP